MNRQQNMTKNHVGEIYTCEDINCDFWLYEFRSKKISKLCWCSLYLGRKWKKQQKNGGKRGSRFWFFKICSTVNTFKKAWKMLPTERCINKVYFFVEKGHPPHSERRMLKHACFFHEFSAVFDKKFIA